jgi:hypothetical protein
MTHPNARTAVLARRLVVTRSLSGGRRLLLQRAHRLWW